MIKTSEIDADLRGQLAGSVRKLIVGEMTNDEFDAVYDECVGSRDRGVREIAAFCWGLYSSDVLFSYRLKGRHRVNAEVLNQAERAVLFLRSELEYQWPPAPDDPGYRSLAGAAFSFGIPASVAFGLIGVMLLFDNDANFGILPTVSAILLLVGSVVVLTRRPNSLVKEWQAFHASGDFDAWPFLRREDLEAVHKCDEIGREAL